MSNKTNPITFAKAKQMSEEGTSAIVLRGAGSEEYRDNWINGINNELIEDGIFESPMTEVYLLPTIHDERIDIVTLENLSVDDVDMTTVVLVGASTTRRIEDRNGAARVYTPRGYGDKLPEGHKP